MKKIIEYLEIGILLGVLIGGIVSIYKAIPHFLIDELVWYHLYNLVIIIISISCGISLILIVMGAVLYVMDYIHYIRRWMPIKKRYRSAKEGNKYVIYSKDDFLKKYKYHSQFDNEVDLVAEIIKLRKIVDMEEIEKRNKRIWLDI